MKEVRGIVARLSGVISLCFAYALSCFHNFLIPGLPPSQLTHSQINLEWGFPIPHSQADLECGDFFIPSLNYNM